MKNTTCTLDDAIHLAKEMSVSITLQDWPSRCYVIEVEEKYFKLEHLADEQQDRFINSNHSSNSSDVCVTDTASSNETLSEVDDTILRWHSFVLGCYSCCDFICACEHCSVCDTNSSVNFLFQNGCKSTYLCVITAPRPVPLQ
jgi:hypothetical protein